MTKSPANKTGTAARRIAVDGDVKAERDVIIGDQYVTADLTRVEALLAQIVQALSEPQASVRVQGDVEHSVIITGSGNQLQLNQTDLDALGVLQRSASMSIGWAQAKPCLPPKGIPHTYHVESLAGGRWLTITVRGDFERFVQAMARPAEHIDLPKPAGTPSAEAIQALTATAAQYGIEIVGPPLH